MIPLVIPPLSNLRVLVTRPATQAEALCTAIAKLGGEAIRFPAIDIKPRDVALDTFEYDLVIFVSTNAVAHGLLLFRKLQNAPGVAAIGKATAAALKEAGVEATIVAPPPFNSEALLQHVALQSPPKSILLIKGAGGRDVLHDTLSARGAQVCIADVYERATVATDTQNRIGVQRALQDESIDVISITSVDIAQALTALLDKSDLLLARRCTVLAGSTRIATWLASMGWQAEMVISDSPDDESMLKALTRWHTRSRC